MQYMLFQSSVLFCSLSRLLWQSPHWVQHCPCALPSGSIVFTPQGWCSHLLSLSFLLPSTIFSAFKIFPKFGLLQCNRKRRQMCIVQAWDAKLAPLHKLGVSGCREAFAEGDAKIYVLLLCKFSHGTKFLFLCWFLRVWSEMFRIAFTL